MCVCARVHVCVYLKGFQRTKLRSYKFITAAKLIVSSVKDQLGKKPLKGICRKMQCQMLLTMMVQVL